MSRSLWTSIACFAFLFFAVAGCGGDDGESDRTKKVPRKVTVTIKDFKYSPQRVVVARGGTIMWVNKEARTRHTATKTRGPSYAPNSPNIGWGGGTYTDFFKRRGKIKYVCTYHPRRMKGFITVQ
jgi:plastocyanin